MRINWCLLYQGLETTFGIICSAFTSAKIIAFREPTAGVDPNQDGNFGIMCLNCRMKGITTLVTTLTWMKQKDVID